MSQYSLRPNPLLTDKRPLCHSSQRSRTTREPAGLTGLKSSFPHFVPQLFSHIKGNKEKINCPCPECFQSPCELVSKSDPQNLVAVKNFSSHYVTFGHSDSQQHHPIKNNSFKANDIETGSPFSKDPMEKKDFSSSIPSLVPNKSTSSKRLLQMKQIERFSTQQHLKTSNRFKTLGWNSLPTIFSNNFYSQSISMSKKKRKLYLQNFQSLLSVIQTFIALVLLLSFLLPNTLAIPIR